MQLPPDQVARFYGIWQPLLLFVNGRLGLVPGLGDPAVSGPWEVSNVLKLRDALWADDSLRRDFIAENPAGLSAADLAIAQGWDGRLAGKFYALRHLKKHTLFLPEGRKVVYGVLGLA